MLTIELPVLWVVHHALVLARVAAIVAFVPIPGMRRGLAPAKVVLALSLAFVLAPPALASIDASIVEGPAAVWRMAQMALAEAIFGAAIGVAVSLLLDAFGVAAQILGFQAGYSYVNMVDPTTQVDASILNVLLALLSSLLFFAFDFHLHVVRALAESFSHWPLGAFVTRPADAGVMIELGAAMLDTAVRLAFPLVAVLLLIDLTLGLMNQVHPRMQLLTLAFPAKIVAAIALLYPVAVVTPRLFHGLAELTLEAITAIVQR